MDNKTFLETIVAKADTGGDIIDLQNEYFNKAFGPIPRPKEEFYKELERSLLSKRLLRIHNLQITTKRQHKDKPKDNTKTNKMAYQFVNQHELAQIFYEKVEGKIEGNLMKNIVEGNLIKNVENFFKPYDLNTERVYGYIASKHLRTLYLSNKLIDILNKDNNQNKYVLVYRN